MPPRSSTLGALTAFVQQILRERDFECILCVHSAKIRLRSIITCTFYCFVQIYFLLPYLQRMA